MVKEDKIRKEDLKLIGIELANLKFNTGGHDLLCEYVESKLTDEGVDIEFDNVTGKVKLNDMVIDYSMKSKKEGIKHMVVEIVNSGEDKGLNNKTPLGVWLNHAVETIGIKTIEIVTESFAKIVEERGDNLWLMYGKNNTEELMNLNGVDVYVVDTMFKRCASNVKQLKFDLFERFNKYVW